MLRYTISLFTSTGYINGDRQSLILRLTYFEIVNAYIIGCIKQISLVDLKIMTYDLTIRFSAIIED